MARNYVPDPANWTLDGDAQLLERMVSMGKNLENRCNQVSDDLKQLVCRADGTTVELGNVANKLNHLQQNQFVESRVAEEINELPTNDVTADVKQVSDVEATKKLLDESVKMLNKCYEKVSLDQDDESDTEDDKLRFAYRPINPYEHKRRPYIIGTKEWLEKYHIGLQSSEDDDGETDDEASETESHLTDVPQLPAVPQVVEPIQQFFIPPAPKTTLPQIHIPDTKSIPINSTTISNVFNDEPPDLDTISEKSKTFFTESDDENQNFLPVHRPPPVPTFLPPCDETDQRAAPNRSSQLASQAAAAVAARKGVSNLFAEDSDDEIIPAKPKAISTEIEYTLRRNEQKTPQAKIVPPNLAKVEAPQPVIEEKPKETKKKITNLFDDDSDDDFFLSVKSKKTSEVKKTEEKKPEMEKAPVKVPEVKKPDTIATGSSITSAILKQKRNLFEDSEDEDDDDFFKPPPRVARKEPEITPKYSEKVEPPKIEPLKVELPKAEPPKIEPRKLEQSKAESEPAKAEHSKTPAIEPRKFEQPKDELPKAEPPKIEPQKLEQPKVESEPAKAEHSETPIIEPRKLVQPRVDLPKAEPPKDESRKLESSKVESAMVEPAKVEPPNVEAPKVEPRKVEPFKVTPKVVQPEVSKASSEEKVQGCVEDAEKLPTPIKDQKFQESFSDGESITPVHEVSDEFFTGSSQVTTPHSETFESLPSASMNYQNFFNDLPPDDVGDFEDAYNDDDFMDEPEKPAATFNPYLILDEPPPDDVDDDTKSFKDKFSMFQGDAKPDPEPERVRPLPKKLNINFNINVGALLPGAKRPKAPESPEEKVEHAEGVPDVFTPKRQIRPEEILDTTPKFNTPVAPSGSNLLTSLNKNRAKLPSRRPSTRKARVENFRKATNDDDETDVPQKPMTIADMLKKAETGLRRKSLVFDEDDDDVKVPEVVQVPPKSGVSLEAEKIENAEVKHVKPKNITKKDIEKIGDADTKKEVGKSFEDELFKKVNKKEVDVPKEDRSKAFTDELFKKVTKKTVEVEKKLISEPIKKVVDPLHNQESAPQENIKKTSPNRKPILFEEQPVKPKNQVISSLFDDDDDDDLDFLSSVQKPKQEELPKPKQTEPTIKPTTISSQSSHIPAPKSIFGNDDDDDDLFSAPALVKATITSKPVVAAAPRPSLFREDSDDDLFSTAKMAPEVVKVDVVKSEVKKKERIVEPKKIEKPKSLFGDDDDDSDDMFSTKVTKAAPANKSMPVKMPQASLFGDDDGEDDDLFGGAVKKPEIKKSAPPSKPTTTTTEKVKKSSVTSNDPLADLLNQ